MLLILSLYITNNMVHVIKGSVKCFKRIISTFSSNILDIEGDLNLSLEGAIVDYNTNTNISQPWLFTDTVVDPLKTKLHSCNQSTKIKCKVKTCYNLLGYIRLHMS